MLMMLAFLIDEAQKLCCSFFKKARQRARINRNLWQAMQILVQYFIFDSWQAMYELIADPSKALVINSS